MAGLEVDAGQGGVPTSVADQLYLEVRDEMNSQRVEILSLREEVDRLRGLSGEVERLRGLNEEVERLKGLSGKVERLRGLSEEVETLRARNLELEKEVARLKGETGGNKGGWKVVSCSAGTRVKLRKGDREGEVQVENKFASLADEGEGLEGSENREGKDRGKVSSEGSRRFSEGNRTGKVRRGKGAGSEVKAKGKRRRKVVIMGDSQVRHLGGAVSSEVGKVVCLPGAGIERVTRELGHIMDNGDSPVVCLSVGGNDVGRVRSVELRDRFSKALEYVRTKGGTLAVCGVLPRRGAGREWSSRAIGLNCFLEDYCKENAIVYIDNWSRFYGRDYMYTRDGVHLSRRGVAELGRSIGRELGF